MTESTSAPSASAPPETAEFSRIAGMAERLLEVPVATVLTRGPNGWHRADAGDGAHPPAAERLIREILDQSALLDSAREELFVVADVDDDPRLTRAVPELASDSDTEARLRFLAAAFFGQRTGEKTTLPNQAFGCLCVLDSKPRQLRAEDRDLLAGFARQLAEIHAETSPAKAPPPPASPAPEPSRAVVPLAPGALPPLDALMARAPAPAQSASPAPAAPPAPIKLTSHIERAPEAFRTADLTTISQRKVEVPPAAPAAPLTREALEAKVAELTRANEALRAEVGSGKDGDLSRMRLEQLFEESPDFIALASLDGKTYHLNQAGRRLVGLDGMEDVRRTRVIDYLMREDRSFFLGTVVPTLMRTGRWIGDSSFRNFKSGASIPVSWNLFLIRDPATGDPAGMATFARDISERQKSEAALRESERRFRHLVEQAGESILVYDMTGRLIDVNQESCDSLGYPRSELLTLSITDIEDKADAEKNRDRWKNMVPGVAVTLDGTLRRRDGTTFPTEARVAVFRSEGQKLVLALVRDVTERRRAQAALEAAQEELEERVRARTMELARANDDLRGSERRFASMTANVPGMVYQLVLHSDGTANFPYVSGGCRGLFSLEPAQMQADACTLLDLIHGDDIDRFLTSLEDSKKSGDAWTWEGRYSLPGSADVRWLQGAARPEGRDGGDTLWDGLLLDITTRKRGEAAINQAREEAEKANAAKSEFLSRMSHELRTPLNAILGFGQLLQMQKLPEAQHERIGHIVHAGRHLLSLINEVLDISRIEAGRVELSLEPVKLSEVVNETLDLIRPLAAERNINIHCAAADDPLHKQYVLADRQRFKQVMLNLLSNAVKYNRESGDVRIAFHLLGDERVSVSVADTGVGIAPENLTRLFVAFDRLGAENSNVQGTGLGLALSKRLIEAMNGLVLVNSKPGEGTTFTVELPKAEGQLDSISRQLRNGQGGPEAIADFTRAHHILYIEDNLSNLTLIEHLLADRADIRLTTAMQGRLGLDLARKHLPDLILLDLHLPDMPGWDVLAELQKDDATKHIPVVAVSADATPRQNERLMKLGARAYLTKPIDVDRFQRTLRQVLEPENAPTSVIV